MSHPKEDPRQVAARINPAALNLPVIDRDAGWCLKHLAGALTALSSLCESDTPEDAGRCEFITRGELCSLFAVLGDYADAARRAAPETEIVIGVLQ